jgi:ribosomal protein S18 acetylase RimI-like enzyme
MSLYAPYEPRAMRPPPAKVRVRAAELRDVPAIAKIDAERHGDQVERLVPLISTDLERIAQGTVRRYTCVATLKGRVAGFAKCGYLTWEGKPAVGLPRCWYLSGIVVAPAYWRRGIGRELTLHRLAWLRERTDVVYYFADDDNGASIDLHTALGFEEVEGSLSIPGRSPGDGRQILFRMFLG